MGSESSSMELAEQLLGHLGARNYTIATAESLTGGLLVARLVDVPGASQVVKGGACTYSFDAKASLLGLDLADLQVNGAVRPCVAEQMARGAQRIYQADLALSTTGVAGPGPDAFDVPQGTVFIACALGQEVQVRDLHLTGSRASIRSRVVNEALRFALCLVKKQK